MKIRELSTFNYQGLKGNRTFHFEPVTAFCQKNSTGKTSLLNALKYGLSGQPDISTYGENKMAVRIVFEDGRSVSRMKMNGKNVAYVDNKHTTIKNANDAVASSAGVPMEAIRVASSEEALMAIKPEDFQKLILSYTDDRLDIDSLFELVPELTPSELEIMQKRLPEQFGVADLQKFYKGINEDRLTQQRAIKAKEAAIELYREQKPTESKEELMAEFQRLTDVVADGKAYLEKKKAYDTAFNLKKQHDEKIAAYKKEIGENKAAKRDDEELLVWAVQTKRKNLDVAQKAMGSFEESVASAEKVLERLDKPVCPLSEKLVCTTDKTSVREELMKSLDSSKNGLLEQKKLIETLRGGIEKDEKNLEACRKEKTLYEKKVFLMKELEKLEGQKISLPEEPKKPLEENASKKMDEVKKKILIWNNLEKAAREEERVKRGRIVLADFEDLCSLFAPKGVAMERIAAKYMKAFEEICNEKAEKLRPGLEVKFVSDNGVHVYLNINDAWLGYDDLSGGEKALFVYLMLDMLNTLSGLRILILDELSVLDAEGFDALMKLITENKDSYDHVLIAMVDHDDTKAILEKYGVVIMEI